MNVNVLHFHHRQVYISAGAAGGYLEIFNRSQAPIVHDISNILLLILGLSDMEN